MHEAVGAANSAISILNTISPEWYIAGVGPLTNVAIHFIKLERSEQKKLSPGTVRVLAFLLPVLAGAFYGVLHTAGGQGMQAYVAGVLKDTALVGSPIYLIGQALYFKVSRKLEERHELIRNAGGGLEINPNEPTPEAELPAAQPAADGGTVAGGHVDF